MGVAYSYLVHVVSVVDFITSERPPPGSIWVDTKGLKKVPIDMKMLVMDENAANNPATR